MVAPCLVWSAPWPDWVCWPMSWSTSAVSGRIVSNAWVQATPAECQQTSSLATRAPMDELQDIGLAVQSSARLTTLLGQYIITWSTILSAGAVRDDLHAALRRPVQARVRQARVRRRPALCNPRPSPVRPTQPGSAGWGGGSNARRRRGRSPTPRPPQRPAPSGVGWWGSPNARRGRDRSPTPRLSQCPALSRGGAGGARDAGGRPGHFPRAGASPAPGTFWSGAAGGSSVRDSGAAVPPRTTYPERPASCGGPGGWGKHGMSVLWLEKSYRLGASKGRAGA
jgi:hypothetical protein